MYHLFVCWSITNGTSWSFFVCQPFLLLPCQIYVLHTTKSKNVKKKNQKNFNLCPFLINCAPANLPLQVPVPIIPTSNRFSSSKILKFKFVVVFDRFIGFCDNRSNCWRAVLEAISVFESLTRSKRRSLSSFFYLSSPRRLPASPLPPLLQYPTPPPLLVALVAAPSCHRRHPGRPSAALCHQVSPRRCSPLSCTAHPIRAPLRSGPVV
jgi:hypothetical protein